MDDRSEKEKLWPMADRMAERLAIGRTIQGYKVVVGIEPDAVVMMTVIPGEKPADLVEVYRRRRIKVGSLANARERTKRVRVRRKGKSLDNRPPIGPN